MKTLVNNWNIVRIIRLALGVAAIAQGVTTNEYILTIAGVLILFMALLNIGCCGASGCSIQPKKNETNNAKEVIYEEVGK